MIRDKKYDEDLEGEVLIKRTKLDDLNNENTNLKNRKMVKNKQISSKKSKILMAVFGGVGALGIAGGVTGAVIGINKAKEAGDREETKEHDITLKQPEEAYNWTLTCDKIKAKKGEKVKFVIITQEENITKYPSQVSINNFKFDTSKINEKEYQAEVEISFIENMTVSFCLSDIIDPEILKPHDIEIKEEEKPEGLKDITISKTSAKVGEEIDVNIKVAPEYKARMLIVNDTYAYAFEEVQANEFEDLKYKTTFKMPAAKVNLKVELQERLVIFPNIMNVVTEEATTLVPHLAEGVKIQYSEDKCETWKDLESDKEISFEKYKAIYFRGINKKGLSVSVDKSTKLTFKEGKIYIYGSIMGLLDNGGDGCDRIYNIPSNYCFTNLFAGSNAIVETNTEFLPSTVLTKACYQNLFADCLNLEYAPALPATELKEQCYSNMFNCCESLKQAPALPATEVKEESYYAMFKGCKLLISAPSLPATTLAKGCYGSMFMNCSSLTTAPELPAETLAEECYDWMFDNCENLNLIKGYTLPAVNMKEKCYAQMFRQCSKLTTAPVIKATSVAARCFDSMFQECKKLDVIKSETTIEGKTLFFTCPDFDPTTYSETNCPTYKMFNKTIQPVSDPRAGETFYN